MIRSIPIHTLQELQLGNLVEPMVWMYVPSHCFNLGPEIWDKYSAVFSHVWVASAFKGATGSCQISPNHKYHVSNHEAWISEISTYGSRMPSFRGITFTGWSRYDHYATLCEILPVALPSLALCLKTWLSAGFSSNVLSSVSKMLGYEEPPLTLDPPVRPYPLSQTVTFPGNFIAVSIDWFANLKAKFNSVVHGDQIQTWLNPWQIQNNYTNPMQIESLIPTLTDLLLEASALESYARNHLDHFYYQHTIDEIIGTLLTPMKTQLLQIKNDCEIQVSAGCRVRGMRTALL